MPGERGVRYWLMKSEPDAFSIDDLKKRKRSPWDGVRSFMARNQMQAMRVGDLALFYHSSTEPPGVVGLSRVVREAYPDHTQFDRKSKYFDAKSTRETPRWMHVDVKLNKKTRLLSLREMRERPELADMIVLRPGNRLSITPVEPAQWRAVLALLRA